MGSVQPRHTRAITSALPVSLHDGRAEDWWSVRQARPRTAISAMADRVPAVGSGGVAAWTGWVGEPVHAAGCELRECRTGVDPDIIPRDEPAAKIEDAQDADPDAAAVARVCP